MGTVRKQAFNPKAPLLVFLFLASIGEWVWAQAPLMPMTALLEQALGIDDQWSLIHEDKALADLRLERALIEVEGEVAEATAWAAYHASMGDLGRQTVQLVQAKLELAYLWGGGMQEWRH